MPVLRRDDLFLMVCLRSSSNNDRIETTDVNDVLLMEMINEPIDSSDAKNSNDMSCLTELRLDEINEEKKVRAFPPEQLNNRSAIPMTNRTSKGESRERLSISLQFFENSLGSLLRHARGYKTDPSFSSF